MTPLDQAHAGMEADDARRLRFFEVLASSELFVLLTGEGSESPQVFKTGDGTFLLAFDREDRLSAFAEGPAPYAALSGRAIAEMIGGQDVGLGLNLGVAPSSMLIPADAVAWLAGVLGQAPEEVQAIPDEVLPPHVPDNLLASLDTRLASAEGLASHALLADVVYRDRRRGTMLAFIDALPEAEHALARAVSEAVAFSGRDDLALDVLFLTAGDGITARLEKVGLRFDLPKPQRPEPPVPDPSTPPRLR